MTNTRTYADVEKEMLELREERRMQNQVIASLREDINYSQQITRAHCDEIERLKGALKAAHCLLDVYLRGEKNDRDSRKV